MSEIKQWQNAVTKASLAFDTLQVELQNVACASGSLLFAIDDADVCLVTVNPGSDAKLMELDKTRVGKRHIRAILLYLLGYCDTVVEPQQPPQKKIRGKAQQKPLCHSRMTAAYANTPIRWDDVTTNNINAVVAFLD